jgi:ADP-heptose:LPS heptosyltransferase
VALYREIWGIDPHERQQLSKLGPEWHGGMPISDIQDSLKKERRVTVLIKRGMGGYGDILFSTVIARELKALGKKCRVVYAVPDRYRCVLTNNPNIDAIYLHDNPVPEGCSYSIDITDVEFRIEQIEMQKYGEIKSPRTKIYLNLIHSDSDNLKPDYFVMDEERLWAERLWKMPEKKKRILIVEKGSNKLKVWKPIRSLGIKLANQHSVVISFEDDTSFTFRQAAALVSLADLVVSPDSGLSNLAGALNVPVLTLFSNRNGSVFSKMFKSMRPIQGKCSLFPKRNYCDFFTPCLGSGPHRAKENIRIPDCMTHLDLEQVLKVAKEMLEADR